MSSTSRRVGYEACSTSYYGGATMSSDRKTMIRFVRASELLAEAAQRRAARSEAAET